MSADDVHPHQPFSPPPGPLDPPPPQITETMPVVTRGVEPTPDRKRSALLPWLVAALVAALAIVFGVLWSSKRSDADGAAKRRDQLAAENRNLNDDVDAAKATAKKTQTALDQATKDVAAAKGDADTARQKVTAAQGDADAAKKEAATQRRAATDAASQAADLQSQVTQLQSELDATKNTPTSSIAIKYAPRTSLELGKRLGDKADPALNDDEARCIGGTTIDLLGLDFIFLDFSSGNPTDAQSKQVASSVVIAAISCGVSTTRLNL